MFDDRQLQLKATDVYCSTSLKVWLRIRVRVSV